MAILIKKPGDIKPSEITPKSVYLNRRKFMQRTITGSLLLGAEALLPAWAKPWKNLPKSPYDAHDKLNTLYQITHYNNFYEFGTSKTDPYKNAGSFNPRPWSVTVDGECNRKGTFALEDFIKPYKLEERIYRHRCVEGWSMVIPWVGFSLADMLKSFEPTSKARYVQFVTLYDPKRMPGQQSGVLNWPYVEGLRIDEAMNVLPIMAVGLYGDILPNQNGAPMRLVVPWKYGFKSIKSIVRIRFTETQPETTWNTEAPDVYGFYSNVNPHVDRVRWSQATETRIGDPFWRPKRKTLMFNGYGEQVASLYRGMDLKKYF